MSRVPEWMPANSDLVLDRGTPSLTCLLRVPDDLPIFRAHFPSVPIIPAVIQTAWALELARSDALADGPLIAISNAKFRRAVPPGMCLAARVKRSAVAGQLLFSYELADANELTGCLRLGGDDD